MPLVLVVPKNALYRLWTTAPTEGKICVVGVDGDYYEAILCADRISSKETFRSEGGARNVARRDGMGTVIIDAALTMKGTPQHYFQAVGSSTGGIAAWEASLRLREDGRFGSSLPKLHLAQNVPCAPIYYSWTGEEETLEGCPQGMYDDVLFNRRPPYLVAGGVADALRGTGGEVYGITNREATEAERLFLDLEGIDILPAAAVAVAALMKAVERNTVDRDDLILLNITGGGVSRLKEEKTLNPLKCDFVARPKDPEDRVLAMVKEVLRGKTA
jgi:cysteate synthase